MAMMVLDTGWYKSTFMVDEKLTVITTKGEAISRIPTCNAIECKCIYGFQFAEAERVLVIFMFQSEKAFKMEVKLAGCTMVDIAMTTVTTIIANGAAAIGWG